MPSKCMRGGRRLNIDGLIGDGRCIAAEGGGDGTRNEFFDGQITVTPCSVCKRMLDEHVINLMFEHLE